VSRQDIRSPVDLDMLTMALQAGDLDTGWWLDTRTGEVIPEPDSRGNEQERGIMEARESEPGRYIDIQPLPPSIMIDLMESFIATLDDQSYCESLRQALSKKQSAWHFKGALAANPGYEDAWYAFKEQFYALQARQWARDMGLDYEIRGLPSDTYEGPAVGLAETTGQEIMTLFFPMSEGWRRYVLCRESGLTLTAYQGSDSTPEQVVGEVTIEQNQLESINHVLEQLTFQVSHPLEEGSHDSAMAMLQVASGPYQIGISSPLQAGNVQDQLQTLFNFLLGIAPLG